MGWKFNFEDAIAILLTHLLMNLFFSCAFYVFNCIISSAHMSDLESLSSIEYWFRCMDVDGDGFLSMYELEYFYQEQLQRLEALGIETLPFTDCLCQVGLLEILIFTNFCLFFQMHSL